ncbi:hypothetical protein NDU88_003876 [Pleurodeles waltl]|uniref:Uncharacterized protein n=1 Tax=Pleurodeles waltl TaxID=8319 RepID=A0AAV7W694_PLEWA|nr:hypothetical protein NDU88_003876 [Pleurodeles waltl]
MEDSSQARVRGGEAAPPRSIAPPVVQAVKLNIPNSESGMAKQRLLAHAGSPAAGSGTQKNAHLPPQYRWRSGRFPRAGAGDNSSSEVGARDKALGERRLRPVSDSPGGTKDTEKDTLSCLSAKTARLRGQVMLQESGDQVRRQSHPVGPKMLKNAHGCISAKAAQLRGAGDLDANQSSVLVCRAQRHQLTPKNPVRVRRIKGGQWWGGHQREGGESGLTSKSDPNPQELLEVRPSRRPSC